MSRRPRLPSPGGWRPAALVIGLWLVVASIAGPFAVKLSTEQDNSSLTALPASAEAQVERNRATVEFADAGALVAVTVYARETGLTAADRAKVDADRAAFARYARTGQVPAPSVSADGKAAVVAFPLAGDDAAQGTAAEKVKDGLRAGLPPGLRAALTGTAGGNQDAMDAFKGMDTSLLLAAGLAVALLLLLTYRSPILWLVPLLITAVADQAASAIVYLLSKHAGLVVDFQAQSILTVLVFGVGVDYALLLIARYREELHRHPDRYTAMRVALNRSAGAVIASAATVSAGLLCLLAARMPATHSLGPVAAIGVVAALVAMTTFLPALLAVCGRWLFWPFIPRCTEQDAGVPRPDTGRPRGWGRLADAVCRRPGRVWVGAVVVLGALSVGSVTMGMGLHDDQMFTREVGSVTGQRMIAAHFPAGTGEPAEIVAPSASGAQVVQAVRTVAGVAGVQGPVPSADGRWVRVTAVLADPPDSGSAADTIDRLRAAVHRAGGADAVVGGRTATHLDEREAVDRDNRVVMALIIGVILLILVVLLRSVVAPLLLTGSVVLSYAAALGASALVLNALGYHRLYLGVPLEAFLFLVALGVDYTIFLMTRAREEVATSGHREGVRGALAVTGGVITSAGLVLAATFAVLGVLPLVPSLEVGVVVAVGVLLDTFVVRSLLVPALAVGVGSRWWWPGRPHVRATPPEGEYRQPEVAGARR